MRQLVWTAVALALVVCCDAFAENGDVSGEWPYYGGDQANRKYSALDQINKDNAKNKDKNKNQNFGNQGGTNQFKQGSRDDDRGGGGGNQRKQKTFGDQGGGGGGQGGQRAQGDQGGGGGGGGGGGDKKCQKHPERPECQGRN